MPGRGRPKKNGGNISVIDGGRQGQLCQRRCAEPLKPMTRGHNISEKTFAKQACAR
jgi:hypothetical protein